MSDRFDELVGEIEDPDETTGCGACTSCCSRSTRRPRSPPRWRRRSRGRAGAALAAPAAHGARPDRGGARRGRRSAPAGSRAPRSDDVEAVVSIPMVGTAQAAGATASIELLPQDESGNWPMNVVVRGLTPSRDRSDYYELWLTKGGKLADPCGRFIVHTGADEGRLSASRTACGSTTAGSSRGTARTCRSSQPPRPKTSGCQSSKRFPSGSTAQPKRPNSCSSTFSSTSAPAARSCCEHRVEVVDAVVDHHLLLVRPVAGVAGEDRPDGRGSRHGLEDVAAPLRDRDPEVRLVPRAKRLGVTSPEEDAADPGDALHPQGAVRSFATNAACVIGIRSARNCSHASA